MVSVILGLRVPERRGILLEMVSTFSAKPHRHSMKKYAVYAFVLAATLMPTASFTAYKAGTDPATAHGPMPPDRLGFDDAFTLEKTITLQGSDAAPLFSKGYIAFSQERIVVPDPKNHVVHVFDHEGKRAFVIGREGKGPGEFKEPNWAAMDHEGRIYIRDGFDNFKVQLFEQDGTLADQFPLFAFGPFEESSLVKENGAYYVYTTTRTYCGEEGKSALCTMQKQDLSGEVVAKFGEELEIEPGRKGLPFVAGFYNAERIYIAHRLGSHIAAYSFDGTLLDRFDHSISAEARVLDMDKLPDSANTEAWFEVRRKNTYTMLRRMYFYKDLIVVERMRINDPDQRTMHFLDMFDHDGNLVYEGIESPYALETILDDQFVFFTENEEALLGEIQLMTYSFSPE